MKDSYPDLNYQYCWCNKSLHTVEFEAFHDTLAFKSQIVVLHCTVWVNEYIEYSWMSRVFTMIITFSNRNNRWSITKD